VEEVSLILSLRSVARAVKLTAIFLYGGLELIVARPVTREARAEWLHRFCMRVTRAMGVAIRIEGIFPERGVVVSNHLGYLDIVSLAAQHQCVFVSKAELAEVPLIGWMTTMAGTVYVERGRGGSALRAKSGLNAAMDAGLPIVLFPEGTTSNGASVLPFHSGALGQAIETKLPVTAAFVQYRMTQDNGPGVSVENDLAFWGDEVQLFPHIFRLLSLRGIEVSIRIADQPIAFSADAMDRRQAAQQARAAVMQLGGLENHAPMADNA
jgi:1-acyl-sn-glycerol-3-phosphate acyltransferase